MMGHKTMCSVQSHQMAKIVCKSQVTLQSLLGVVSFSIRKKIRKCLAEVTCSELGNKPLISILSLLLQCFVPLINKTGHGVWNTVSFSMFLIN